MITVFGEEFLKPLVKYGKKIPLYSIPKDGRGIYSEKTGRFLATHPRGKTEYLKTSVNIPKELFDDYDYHLDNSKFCRVTFDIHRAVMEAWKPIDKYPPESLKSSWWDVPEEWRKWVRETALIDHIDCNPLNNHIDNLRWLTPKENNYYRKSLESNEFT
jgi:hypothetical protein